MKTLTFSYSDLGSADQQHFRDGLRAALAGSSSLESTSDAHLDMILRAEPEIEISFRGVIPDHWSFEAGRIFGKRLKEEQ